MKAHPTAIVDPKAKIDESVEIGPYCIIGPDVVLAANVKLHSHVCISGNTEIGEGTEIFPFASIGFAPQDLKFKGEQSRLIIGKKNVIREYVTMHPGTEGGGMLTKVGDNCLFMISAHVAHDCTVGNNVILANNATLAGHVSVGDCTILGGLSAVHQFVRIGSHVIVGGVSAVVEDVIPFASVKGDRAKLHGLNNVGLRRRNFSRQQIKDIRDSYKKLFLSDNDTLSARIEAVAQEYNESPEVMKIINFLRSAGSRSICLP